MVSGYNFGNNLKSRYAKKPYPTVKHLSFKNKNALN